MGYLIRQKWNIKGTSFGKKNVCLLTYAYDTVYSLSDLKKKHVKSTMHLLFQFAKYSGLKLNFSCSKVVWIGLNINYNDFLRNISKNGHQSRLQCLE